MSRVTQPKTLLKSHRKYAAFKILHCPRLQIKPHLKNNIDKCFAGEELGSFL